MIPAPSLAAERGSWTRAAGGPFAPEKGDTSHARPPWQHDRLAANEKEIEALRSLMLTLALAATTLSAALWAGEVYRTVAPDGTVIYSDRPEGENSKPFFVYVPRSSSQRAASRGTIPQENAAGAPDSSAERDSADEGEDSAPAPGTAEERAKNCEIARDRAERYSVAHRLYRALPNGEREYLTDSEIDEAKAQAAADVEAWCN
jgi:hypothetical protein